MSVLSVNVLGVGLRGPGLEGWEKSAPLLRDAALWRAAPTVIPAPERLPSAERRRSGAIVKLSIAAAEEACVAAGIDTRSLATVFTSSSGDVQNCHMLCEALATPERAVSPTRFTNSVHNAPAGYWHIATASRAPSTSLCAFDASFGAGLLEAAAQCVSLARPVLLVAADVPYPQPLHAKRPVGEAFGVAMVLDASPASGSSGDALARLQVSVSHGQPEHCETPSLESLRAQVPAARALPLLRLLAQLALDDPRGSQARRCTLEYLAPATLDVVVAPKGRA